LFYSKNLLERAYYVLARGWYPHHLGGACGASSCQTYPFIVSLEVSPCPLPTGSVCWGGWWVVCLCRSFFFSSFFSLYSRESKCMSSFLLVFQFHFLFFFIVYFHSWPFYNFFMFLIFFLNYNLSYIIFSNSGLAFQFHPSTLDLLGIEFHSFFICSASNLMTRVTSLKT
jgi:hypothetical protein